MDWYHELADKFTEEDAKYVMSMAFSAAARRGNRAVWTSIAGKLSGAFQMKFFHPTYDFFVNADRFERTCSQKASKEDLDKLDRVVNDPFYAVRLEKGDEIADLLINVSKKTYIDAFRDFETCPDYQRPEIYARRFLKEKLKDVCDADTALIMLSGSFIKTCDELLWSYMSTEEQALLNSNRFTFDGKMKAGVLRGADISSRGTASHAMGIVAMETGPEAQAKNPIPRVDSSRPKINRNGGPS